MGFEEEIENLQWQNDELQLVIEAKEDLVEELYGQISELKDNINELEDNLAELEDITGALRTNFKHIINDYNELEYQLKQAGLWNEQLADFFDKHAMWYNDLVVENELEWRGYER